MDAKIIYEVSEDDLKSFVLKTLIDQEVEKELNKYYNVFIDAKTLARFHNVSAITVSRYAKDGLIHPEPRNSNKEPMRFRLSEALKFDFAKLKIQRKTLTNKK